MLRGDSFSLSPRSRRTLLSRAKPVAAFVVASSGLPAKTRTMPHGQQGISPRSVADPSTPVPASTCSTLPVLGLSNTRVTSPRTGYQPAAQDLPRLAAAIIRWVASLVGVTPRGHRIVSLRVPPMGSFRRLNARDFEAQNVKARLYPPMRSLLRFSTASHRTHWQALVVGPSRVELFAAGFCRPVAGLVRPVPPLARKEAPPASQVVRAARALTPWTGFPPALTDCGPRKQSSPRLVAVAPIRGLQKS